MRVYRMAAKQIMKLIEEQIITDFFVKIMRKHF